jgi:hypothetical protein
MENIFVHPEMAHPYVQAVQEESATDVRATACGARALAFESTSNCSRPENRLDSQPTGNIDSRKLGLALSMQ